MALAWKQLAKELSVRLQEAYGEREALRRSHHVLMARTPEARRQEIRDEFLATESLAAALRHLGACLRAEPKKESARPASTETP